VRSLRLLIAFDGTDFSGFQRQPNVRTVQGELEAAVLALTGETTRVRGSSRTDAGVHARELLVSFQTERAYPLRAFHLGLNALLPPDVAVMEAAEAPDGFNARWASLGKTYSYTLWNARSPNPLLRRTAWHLKKPLDVDLVRAALPDLVGSRDFASFRAAHCDAPTTEREVWRATWDVEGDTHRFTICGNAFLRNMVRIVVGTLVEIGLGRRPPDDLRRLFEVLDRTQAGETAPPQGLTLERVFLTRAALFEHLGREVRVYKEPLVDDPT
jgi:tRNA pseudouridine38-40 synthase